MLGWFYVVLFAAQLLLLIRSCRRGRGLGRVLLGNLCSVVLACVLLWYFDTLPGFGIMPGFAYFPEVFYSLCASVIYGVLTLVTLLCLLYYRKK